MNLKEKCEVIVASYTEVPMTVKQQQFRTAVNYVNSYLGKTSTFSTFFAISMDVIKVNIPSPLPVRRPLLKEDEN